MPHPLSAGLEHSPVAAPFKPTPLTQWPAVTTIVGLISVAEQVNQAPGKNWKIFSHLVGDEANFSNVDQTDMRKGHLNQFFGLRRRGGEDTRE